MSEQKHIIEIVPPAYEQVREQMHFLNFRCPVCHGQGSHTEQIGHDDYKTEPCDYCDGTGKVRAEVTVIWKADYGC